MKTSSTLRSGILAAALALAFNAAADDDKVKIKDDKIVVKTDEGKAKIDKDGNVISVKGSQGAEALAKARAELGEEQAEEFRRSLAVGYVVPRDRYTYLQPLPETYVEMVPNRRPELEYRVYGDTIYAVNPTTYAIVDVIQTNTLTGATTTTTTQVAVPANFKQSLVAGYTVPQTYYTYFQPVPERIMTSLPAAPAGVEYRYYDGTVYSINPSTWTIVDVVAY